MNSGRKKYVVEFDEIVQDPGTINEQIKQRDL